MPPQRAAWPPPYLLGRAVGESNLSPNWLATCCQPGQHDLCFLLGLMKGAPGSPKCGRGLSQGRNPNQDAGQVQPPRLLSPLGQSPRCHMSMHRGMGGFLGSEAKPPDSHQGRPGHPTPSTVLSFRWLCCCCWPCWGGADSSGPMVDTAGLGCPGWCRGLGTPTQGAQLGG